MFSIEHISHYIPSKRIALMEHFDQFSLTAEQAKVFTKIYGLQLIPQAGSLSMVDLVCSPVEKLMADMALSGEQIKILIHAHTTKVIAPFGQSIVRSIKNKLQFNQALAFGTTVNNCASTLHALEMAALLLKNFDAHARAIVVTGEKTFTASNKLIPNTSINGDAAAAALISLNGKQNQLLAFEAVTCGQFSKGIWLNAEESKGFEKHYVEYLAQTILRAIQKTPLKLSDIKIILPHNVNLISWHRVAKYLNYPLDKIYLKNIRNYAHCFGSDIFINYAEAQQEGLLKPGDYFVMATVGLGAIFAAAVFQH